MKNQHYLKKVIFIVIIFGLISCETNPNDDIYETKGGEFASKTGNFVIDFPTKPHYRSFDKEIETDKYKFHVFRSTLGPNKIFTIEYTDYPEHIITTMSNDELYQQGVANYSDKMKESFDLLYQESTIQHRLYGQKFQLETNKISKSKGIDGFILGRLFRKGNRMYTITYIGLNDKNAETFVNSFRLLK